MENLMIRCDYLTFSVSFSINLIILQEEDEDDEEPKNKKAKTVNNSKGKTPVKNNSKAKK